MVDATADRRPAAGPPSRRERLWDAFWARHANPLSGATRLPLGAVLVYAIYARRWKLLAATVAFAVVNPVLFPPPERTDHWLSRAVLGEQAWIEDGNRTVWPRYPASLNLVALPAAVYAVYAAARQRPVGTLLGTAAVVGLKLWFVAEMVRYYDTTRGRTG